MASRGNRAIEEPGCVNCSCANSALNGRNSCDVHWQKALMRCLLLARGELTGSKK